MTPDVALPFSRKRHRVPRGVLLALLIGVLSEAGGADEMPPGHALSPAAAAATALRQAQAAIAVARDAGNLWLATPRRLAAARAAVERGDFARAIADAQRAQHEAELALNQALLERARYLLDNTGDLDPSTRATAVDLLSKYDGKAALHLLEQGGGP